jgi:hypothetical protein
VTGSADLYDAATGAFIRTFAPPQSAEFSAFGTSVAIFGDIAAIGAPFDSDGGPGAGAVWLYNLASGTLRRKIVPPGITPNARIGTSVDIHDQLVVMGGLRDGTDGNRAGVAFIYDIDGNFVARLAPPDAGDNVEFGSSVAIDGDRVVVGGRMSADSMAAGTAVLFDTDGEFIEDLLPFASIQNERFGFAADISGDRVVVGAPETLATLNDFSTDRTGAAFVFDLADTDGDGLLDHWETDGIDINRDGTVDLDLPALGADPMKKDLFLEIDTHTDATLAASDIADIETAFANSPVTNPDGTTGIELRVTIDETDLPSRAYIVDDATPTSNLKAEMVAQRAANFGRATDRSSPNADNILAARRLAYRYGVFGGAFTYTNAAGFVTTPSGYGEIPGDDFIVAMKNFTLRPGDAARTIMHELGHTLGLRHGGDDDVNNKVNYFSVMNYMFQLDAAYTAAWSSALRLDYSGVVLPDVDEANLNEAAGIGSSDASTNGRLVAFSNTMPGPAGGTFTLFTGDATPGQPIDFNLDADTMDTGLSISLNDRGGAATIEVHEGHDDWSNLHFALRGSDNFGAGAVGIDGDTLDLGEGGAYTLEQLTLNQNTPVLDLTGGSPCNGADLAEPFGQLTFADIGAFVNAFNTSDLVADLAEPFGQFTFADVGAFLAAFTTGCP